MKWPAERIELIDLNNLKSYEKNPRTHSPEQIQQVARSISEFGWTMPVLIDESHNIIAGHCRVMAAKSLGISQVPTVCAKGWTEAQRRAYLIADNQLTLMGGWDEDLLRGEMIALQGADFDLALTGFDEAGLAGILNTLPQGLTDPDEAPEPPQVPVSSLGDVWLLGRHRLVCGDCTVATVAEKTISGATVALCLTDPPYGLGGHKASGKTDYRGFIDSRDNLKKLIGGWLPMARKIAPVVVFSSGITNQWLYPEPDWVMCWFYGGGQLRSKWGFNCWQPFLCYGKEPSLASGNGARPDAVNLNIPANSSDLDHPCPKPVKLWQWFMDRCIFKPKSIVFDPFCGSGTTLIAAELQGLDVRSIELVPGYVDVAIMRWQNFTRKKATLDGDGRTFDEIAAERTKEAA